MSVLSSRELALLTGKATGPEVEKRMAIAKLDCHQKRKCNLSYVHAINLLIPKAEKIAKRKEKKGEDFDKVFHQSMKHLSVSEGLRR